MQEKLNLVIIGPVYPYRGGISHYTSMLSQSLIERGHAIDIISFKRQYPSWLYPGKSDKDPSQVGLRLETQYILDPIYPWTWTKTARRINDLNPDFVLIQWWTTFWAPAFWVLTRNLNKSGVKVIYVIHNVYPHETLPWDKWLASQVLSLGDDHLVQSASEKERLLFLLPAASPLLCPMPVFNLFPVNRSIDRGQAKKLVSIPQDVTLLLFFGIVRPYKGLKYAIEAVSTLRESGLNVHLVVAGEFWEDIKVYENQISNLNLADHITLVNKYIPDEEVGVYFTAADIYVAPYIDGTQSASVKTALAFNLPNVITDCVADDILRDRKSTRVVPTRDSSALARGISELIAMKEEAGHPDIHEDTTWMNQVIAIEEIASRIRSRASSQ